MADQHQGAAQSAVPLALDVHLGDQRAGGVQHRQTAVGRRFDHRAGDAVGAEDGRRAVRDFRQFVHENGALGLQAIDHMPVMDDLVPDIYQGAPNFSIDFSTMSIARTTPAQNPRGLGQDYPHRNNR